MCRRGVLRFGVELSPNGSREGNAYTLSRMVMMPHKTNAECNPVTTSRKTLFANGSGRGASMMISIFGRSILSSKRAESSSLGANRLGGRRLLLRLRMFAVTLGEGRQSSFVYAAALWDCRCGRAESACSSAAGHSPLHSRAVAKGVATYPFPSSPC